MFWFRWMISHIKQTIEIWKYCQSDYDNFTCFRAVIYYFFGCRNDKITVWTNISDGIEGLPVWHSDIYAKYNSVYDPPDPAYEHIVIAQKWWIPGFNEEEVY